MRKECIILSVVFTFLWLTGFSVEGASIVEEEKVIKTYPFSEPDAVPILARSESERGLPRLYPYFFFDKFNKTAIDKKWKVVRMENPYIH